MPSRPLRIEVFPDEAWPEAEPTGEPELALLFVEGLFPMVMDHCAVVDCSRISGQHRASERTGSERKGEASTSDAPDIVVLVRWGVETAPSYWRRC
jgi:hypothetical protein